MTVIVGLAKKGKVYMAADTAASNWYVSQTLDAPKVFTVGDGRFVIGCCGSVRNRQVIEHYMSLPLQDGGPDIGYMVTVFIPELRRVLDQNNCHISEQEANGSCLVGYNGRLYTIGADFQVGAYKLPYSAIGSGREFALGAMHATENVVLFPEERVLNAVAAAAAFSPTVSMPAIVYKDGEFLDDEFVQVGDSSGETPASD